MSENNEPPTSTPPSIDPGAGEVPADVMEHFYCYEIDNRGGDVCLKQCDDCAGYEGVPTEEEKMRARIQSLTTENNSLREALEKIHKERDDYRKVILDVKLDYWRKNLDEPYGIKKLLAKHPKP